MHKLKSFNLKMPKNYDKLIHLCIIVLLVFGSIMIFSTSVGETNKEQSDIVMNTILKQSMFLITSYIIMVIAAKNFVRLLSREVRINQNTVRNKNIKNFWRGVYRIIGFSIIVLLAFTVLFGTEINGSRAWIHIGSISIQPSEFAKAYMIVLLGIIVNDHGTKRLRFFQFMSEPVLFFIITVVLLLLQPDIGTLMVFSAITAFCLLIPSNPCLLKIKKIILWGIGIVVVGFIFVSTDTGIEVLNKFNIGYKFGRFTGASNPFADPYETGYNLIYSLYAIADGGLTGLGFGASKQKFGRLPEASTDFIFSVIIEEVGFIGLFIIIVCYAIIIYKLFYYAIKTRSDGYKVILIGCALYLSIHFILNIGGVSALIPLTGVPLLFLSSGGSSLISIMCLLGVCQSVIALTNGQMAKALDISAMKKNP